MRPRTTCRPRRGVPLRVEVADLLRLQRQLHLHRRRLENRIFAEKRWKGQTVYYHESLLYEILGNSSFANLLFLELPRIFFNPHKTLNDTKGQSLTQWVES